VTSILTDRFLLDVFDPLVRSGVCPMGSPRRVFLRATLLTTDHAQRSRYQGVTAIAKLHKQDIFKTFLSRALLWGPTQYHFSMQRFDHVTLFVVGSSTIESISALLIIKQFQLSVWMCCGPKGIQVLKHFEDETSGCQAGREMEAMMSLPSFDFFR
jgi:hypothetical protein